MKEIRTDGITFISPVPEGTEEWYYGLNYDHGDLYEAEELYKQGFEIDGRDLILIRYPEGKIFRPVPKRKGTYVESPVYLENGIYILMVDFEDGKIIIYRFDCEDLETSVVKVLPMDMIADCYNLKLHTAPLCLTRQGAEDGRFDIYWPERTGFAMGEHETFFLRDGNKLYFNKWHEEGDGSDYRFWEETVVRDLNGKVTDILEGDVKVMPNGETWHLS